MTDANVMQWLFDLEKMSACFNWPVHVDGFIEAKRGLDAAVAKKAPAADVLRSYQKLSGALGPTVMNALLESDDAFPEVNHSGKPTPPAGGRVTLYVDRAGNRVLAACTKEWGMPPELSVVGG